MPKTTEVSATVSSKGQVVIPSAVRRQLGLAQGSVLRFVMDEEGVRLLTAGSDIRCLKGRLTAPSKPVTVDDMNESIRARRQQLGRG